MFALRFEYLDGVGLFALGTASLKPQHLRTMTLITQHKPIERATDMVFMTKTISNSTYCPFYFSKVWSTTQHVGNSDDNPEGKPPQLSRWHAHQGTVVSVEYLSLEQGALLLTASEDCTARLWTLEGQYIGMFGQVSIALIIFWLPMLEDHSVFTASFLTSFVV